MTTIGTTTLFVSAFAAGLWSGRIDWRQWWKEIRSATIRSIGNQRPYEKVSVADAWDRTKTASDRAYITGVRDAASGEIHWPDGRTEPFDVWKQRTAHMRQK